jgi:ectoine hydroxylase-related dioxygenase (phytanoyl-CoA dioxygenase family)
MSTAPTFSSYGDEYNEHGVVFMKDVLDAAAMTKVTAAYEWSHGHLTGALQDFSMSGAETFIADTNVSAKRSVYQGLLRDTVIADIARDLFGAASSVWYLGEQIFYKEGSEGTRRTPWHQDTSYGNFEGPMMAVVWIPLDPIARGHSLEVIRGSHRGVTYNGSRFTPGDDTAPLYPVSELPRLPDIEQERHKWDIAGSDLSPGDLMAFHMGALHGGGGTPPGVRRRSLSLRFIGNDVTWVERNDEPHPDSSNARRARAKSEGKAVAGASAGQKAAAPPGAPVWESNKFMQVRPWQPWAVRG